MTAPGTAPLAREATAAPRSPGGLFLTYSGISLPAFGGALACTERALVQRKRWFTPKDSLELEQFTAPCWQCC